nr:hypothetical protein [Rickettsia endosymbiont of Ceutorhynchus assimilis]
MRKINIQAVDDVPYGGGAGMVMRSDVVGDAVDSMLSVHKNTKFIYMTPSGTSLIRILPENY